MESRGDKSKKGKREGGEGRFVCAHSSGVFERKFAFCLIPWPQLGPVSL